MSIIEMKVPTIGESITEVTLSQWLKGNGEYVKLDEPICEFESDKATLEFPAEASGKLIHVAKEDDDLEIGALVARIDTAFAEAPAKENRPAEASAKENRPDEASAKDNSPTEAPIQESKTQTAPPAEVSTKAKESATANYATGHPSPAAAKILREGNVDPATVTGTGKDGRITKADAEKAVEQKPQTPTAPVPETKEVIGPISEQALFSRNSRKEKMSRMRRTIASRLVSAKNNTAMLTTFNEADMSAIFKLRKTYQEKFVEKYGVKLGFMSIFSKACAQVLMEMPQVNASLEGNDHLVYHDYVDISIAISTPTGLVVPPIHNVESLSFADIELKIKALAEKARNGTLSLDEMKGGTFTITNGGIFGSMLSTPILNQPQSAILGMHNIINRPVAIEGQVEIRPMMYLALSYDHRVIDGSSSVTFLVKVKELLEDPVKLLMNI
ncbi:MAG: 2-oxoglutarate dehydrogenase complex dihydrolipoyllysine-residue succinyltransferase [Eudoraea sp.]|nr:2-oxoglutarate dehydrogenase complex dihydrolipoyllysine-residue succinyltransferase [Eudoraea sp.]